MNTTESLHYRATQCVKAGACATIAQSHIAQAISHAQLCGMDSTQRHLEIAKSALDRAIHRAEKNRLRLLRKADRNGVKP